MEVKEVPGRLPYPISKGVGRYYMLWNWLPQRYFDRNYSLAFNPSEYGDKVPGFPLALNLLGKGQA